MHRFYAPSLTDKFSSQPIEELWVGRFISHFSKIARTTNEAVTEVVVPNPIYHDARRQRLIGLSEPAGEGHGGLISNGV